MIIIIIITIIIIIIIITNIMCAVQNVWYDFKYIRYILKFCLLCFSSTLVLDKKLIHVVYSKLDRDVLVIAMPAERYVLTRW